MRSSLCLGSLRRALLLSWFTLFAVYNLPVLAQAPAITLTPSIQTLTGVNGSPGDSGTSVPAAGAQINQPDGLAVDAAGNLYFCDYGNDVVRRIDKSTGLMTVVAGSPGVAGFSGDNGPASSATLNGPVSLKFDNAGNLFIGDAGNFVIRRIDAVTSTITTIAGIHGVFGNDGDGGPATSAHIRAPWYMAFDSAGNLYFPDLRAHVVREISNGIISTVAGTGVSGNTGDFGPATSARLFSPTSVTFDQYDDMFITDRDSHVVREVYQGTIYPIAGTGTHGYSGDGGPAASAQLYQPWAAIPNTAGTVFIVDGTNSAIRAIDPLSGNIGTIVGTLQSAGESGDGGPAANALLNRPRGMVFDAIGNYYISDSSNNTIREVSLNSTFADTAVGSTSTQQILLLTLNQAASISSISVPASQGGILEYNVGTVTGCVVDGSTVNASGAVCAVPVSFSPHYVGRRGIPLVVVSNAGTFEFGLTGVGLGPQISFSPALITTVAGTGTAGSAFPIGPAASAQLNLPTGVAVDIAGNVYIADSNNNAVREVDANSQTIATIAGVIGSSGYSGDGGPATAAVLGRPGALTLDSQQNLYFGDYLNSVIRVVNLPSGVINSFAGTPGSPGYSGDFGLAASSQISPDYSQVADSQNNLYIADGASNVIRRVDAPTGIIITSAGVGGSGAFAGDGGPALAASFNNPLAVAIDNRDNLYISDDLNYTIREVNANTGAVSTIAGDGSPGFSGDGSAATGAALNDVEGLVADAAGNLYIADSGNNVVRKVNAATGAITTVAGVGPTAGYSGDQGPATAAKLAYPAFPALDNAGNLYFAEENNNVVRKVGGVAPLTFGSINLNTASAAQDVIISNNGNTALVMTALTSPADYNLSGADTTCTATTSLAPAQSCVLGIVFAPTASGARNETVTLINNQGTQTIPVFGVGTPLPTTTALTASASNVNFGQSVTLTATISPSPTGSPLGTVSFFSGSALLGTETLSSSGVATFTTSGLPAGRDSLTAVFSGNANDAASTSAAAYITVASVTAVLTATVTPASPIYGQAATITVTDKSNGVAVPGATVTMTIHSQTYSCTTSSTGLCTMTVPGGVLTGGSNTVTVAASPTGSSAAGALSFVVTVGPSPTFLTLGSSSSEITVGTPVTLTATVSSATMGTPTGTVTFYANGSAIGTGTTIDGVASLTLATLAVGANSISGVYGGDVNFLGSMASGFTQTVIVNFTLNPGNGPGSAPPTQTVQPGATAVFPLSLGIINGFVGPVTMSATGLPPGATASFDPAIVQLDGIHPGTTTMSVATAAAQARALPTGSPGARPRLSYGLLLLPLLALGGLRRRLRALPRASLAAALGLLSLGAGALSGCGSGGYFGAAPSSYVITVTATSGALHHSTTVTLTIE